nr:uncharacterized protein LOC117456304 [Pseudochaenichthys georgianus]
MVKWCSAGTCRNHHWMADSDGKSKFSFFKFPSHEKQPGRRAQWARACARVDPITRKPWKPKDTVQYVYICSAHFICGQPSKELGHPDYILTSSRMLCVVMARRCLAKQMGPQKISAEWLTQDTSLASSEPPQHQPTPDSPQPSTSSVSPPSVPQQMLFDEISALRAERDAAFAEREHARATLNSVRLSSNTVAENNEKCQYYTGLTWPIFLATFQFLLVSMICKGTPSIPYIDQFFLYDSEVETWHEV